MPKRKSATVVAYNGVDGACAAAMVLLKHPDAEVLVTSAARIGRTIAELAERQKGPFEIHICGVGVHCTWDEVRKPCRRMIDAGASVTWYCGRGYLKSREEAFARIGTPVFTNVGTNTAAVYGHLGLKSDPRASALEELARCDPNLADPVDQKTDEQAFWLDLIEASVAQYIKYQDEKTYHETVRKLARMKYGPSDEKMVAVFRREGYRHMLWGRSHAMRKLREQIRLCSEPDEPVLITGESGVGKEYVAHLIHERSQRMMGPLVPINCALFAGNPALANSTLFGHVKGAFTGAAAARGGAFRTADSGILFLDELADMPLEVQAKLLRVLEDGLVTPEGADKAVKVDVRVVAATSRSLPALIREGIFRADLYHRLDTLQIGVPPLREHLEDIRQIVPVVLESLFEDERPAALSDRDWEQLNGYSWPGNVRQMIKVLKRYRYFGTSISDLIEEERSLGSLVALQNVAGTGVGNPLWPETRAEVQRI